MTLIRPLPLHLGGTSGEQVSHVCVGCKVEEALCKSPPFSSKSLPLPSFLSRTPIDEAVLLSLREWRASVLVHLHFLLLVPQTRRRLFKLAKRAAYFFPPCPVPRRRRRISLGLDPVLRSVAPASIAPPSFMSKPSGWRSSDDTSTKAADDADDSDHDHVHDNNRVAPV